MDLKRMRKCRIVTVGVSTLPREFQAQPTTYSHGREEVVGF